MGARFLMRSSDNKTRASVYLDDARAAEIRDVKVVPIIDSRSVQFQWRNDEERTSAI